MNTTPDETTLALWLDDELTGSELAAVDAWAATHPEQLAAREENRRYLATLRTVIPASLEPPSPELFNARIARAIESHALPTLEVANVITVPFWQNPRSWFMPAAAAAGMALAFWIGNTTGANPGSPATAATLPEVYVPESGIQAEWASSGASQGGVIVISGLSAIPDSTDFSHTVYVPMPREIDRTAGNGSTDSESGSIQ